MTEQEIRIAIAEFCGIKNIRVSKFNPAQLLGDLENDCTVIILDYPNDLNAMRDAWCKLDSKSLRIKFHVLLQDIVVRDGGHLTSTALDVSCCSENATASQRAEALLCTIGKWKDK